MSDGLLYVQVDKCVYTKIIDGECVIIAHYVDDMLIFSTSLDFIHGTKSFLALQFNMKDIGKTNVILGTKFIRRDNSIILSQNHYVEKLLKNFGHFDVKPMSTPYDANTQLNKIEVIQFLNLNMLR